MVGVIAVKTFGPVVLNCVVSIVLRGIVMLFFDFGFRNTSAIKI